MNSLQQVRDNFIHFENGVKKVKENIDNGQLEQALQVASEISYFAWFNNCGISVSILLESLLSSISKKLPRSEKPVVHQGLRRVVMVMTTAYAVGGHTRIAWRWFKRDAGSQHTLVLTQQGDLPIPSQLLDLQAQGLLTIVQLGRSGWCDRIKDLREQLSLADYAVLLTHPHDVIPCVALPGLSAPPKTIFIDHASHTFWLGVTITNLVLKVVPGVLEQRRGISKNNTAWVPLPIDFDDSEVECNIDIRNIFGIPNDAILLMSCASPYKFFPIEGVNFPDLIAPILERHPQAHLILVGVTPTPLWNGVLSRFAGRCHLVGHLLEPALQACYRTADIYLDSIPLTSYTVLLEAAAAGKPLVRFLPSEWNECGFSFELEAIPSALYISSTSLDYERNIDRLIVDIEYRTWLGQFCQRAVRLYHSNEVFAYSIEAAYERVQNLELIQVNLNVLSKQNDRYEQLLSEVLANHRLALSPKAEPLPMASSMEADRISAQHPLFDRFEKSNEVPFIGVVVMSRGGKAEMAKTRASIKAQLRTTDEVIVISEQDSFKEILAQTPASWTLLLCEGDVLESDALLLLERAIVRQASGATKLVYFDHDELGADGRQTGVHYKPDFNQDLLLSYPYMSRAIAIRTEWARAQLLQATGPFNLALAYHLALKVLAEAGKEGFVHVAAVLAHLAPSMTTVFSSTSEEWQSLAAILTEHVNAHEPGAQVTEGAGPGTFNVLHPLARTPLVSIVIPTRDQMPLLSRCIESLLEKTNYPNFEVIVVDNDSQAPDAVSFLTGLAELAPEQIRILRMPGEFNFSRMNNLAVNEARGEFILMLNNDTAALQPDWLGHMVRHALREDVGVVGARLLFPDGLVQHAGMILGLRGPAEQHFLGLKAADPGYLFRAHVQQDFSAVTGACLLVSKLLYQSVGGLDEATFGVSYNDADFCLRVGQTGKRIVWTPLATLLHEGGASLRRHAEATGADSKTAGATKAQSSMYERWPAQIASDPAYNPNLSLVTLGFEVETNPLLRYDKLQGLTPHRVAIFAADSTGCGHYRMFQPMHAMKEAGLCTGGQSPELLNPNLVLRSGADTLVFQRPNVDSTIEVLTALLPFKNIKKIYEVDDYLSRVPIKSAHFSHVPKDTRGRMAKAIGLCDRLVVSTQPLARELAGRNDDIRVVVNRIPPAMWGASPPVKERSSQREGRRKPKIGWAGGVGHRGDLEMIATVIKDLADQVDWVFFGYLPEAIRPYVHEIHSGVPTLEYPKKLMEISQSWDLAIAPLEINVFNECKSNLKLLEYGWCGVPVVCSDITPYQCNLPCRRVKNRYADWRDAILEMISDLDACHLEGQKLQEAVKTSWMLEGRNLQEWYEAWTD